MNHPIAILGCGKMGEAIVAGLIAADPAARARITVTSRRPDVAQALADRHGVNATSDNVVAARNAEIAILCVKPQVAKLVLEAPGMAEALRGKLLVSICAGVRIAQIERWLPEVPVIRAMPNTPALIREGMTVLSPGGLVGKAHLDTAEAIFRAVGRCRILEEKHLDAVTGLSGSGPAFACVVLEALADGGVMMGLPRDVAVELAAQTMQGAARLVLETGLHPAAIKDQVTTPAGCTIAGLLMMEDGKVRSTLARTVQEATRVAGGLGQPDNTKG